LVSVSHTVRAHVGSVKNFGDAGALPLGPVYVGVPKNFGHAGPPPPWDKGRS